MQARSPLEMHALLHPGEESSGSSSSILFSYCYLCQKATSEPLVKNPTNHRKVLGYISERSAFGDPIYSKIEERLTGLSVKSLMSSAATFHGSCYRKTVHVGNYKKIREQYYKLHSRKRPFVSHTNKSGNKCPSLQCLFCNGQRSTKTNPMVKGRLGFESVEKLFSYCQSQSNAPRMQKLVVLLSSAKKCATISSHELCWKKYVIKSVGKILLQPMTPEKMAQDEFLFYLKEKLTFCEEIDISILHQCFISIRKKFKCTKSASRKAVKELVKQKLGDDVIFNKKRKRGTEYVSLSANVKHGFIEKSLEEICFLNDQPDESSQYRLRSSRKSIGGNDFCAAQTSSMGVISLFPNELLLKIFQHLNTEELGRSVLPVCKRWRDVGQDPALWREIILKRDEPNCQKSCASFIRRCPELRSLTITESSNSSPPDVLEIIRAVAASCPHLVELRAPHRPALCYATLRLLATNCPDLQIVDFSHFISPAVVINPNFLLPLVNLKKLNCLNVGHTRFFFGDFFLRKIAEHLKEMEHLDVTGCLFCDDTYRYVLSKISSRIQSLGISPSILTKSFRFITQCRGLKKLHLKVGFHSTSCEQQLSCLRSLTNLHTLRFQFVDLNHNSQLIMLFREPAFARLEVMEVSGYHDNLSDSFMTLLSSTMPLLTEITLSSLVLVTDVGLGRILQQCRHLSKLTLVDMDGLRGSAFEKYSRCLHSLETLKILRCPRITSQVVGELQMKKFFKKINIIWQPC